MTNGRAAQALRTVESFLASFVNYELAPVSGVLSFDLTRVFHLLSLVGQPHQKIKTIQVAGTKGKGSTCAFLAYILRQAGYRVGLYTSPHLSSILERFRILSPENVSGEIFEGCMSPQDFAAQVAFLKPILQKAAPALTGLTLFEIYTVLALCYFKQQNVDWAVLETGLGGRLDATNVCPSSVCVLTPISYDHVLQLGPTLQNIAAEKAAIIKETTRAAVIAPQLPEVLKVIEQRCRAMGTQSFVLEDKILVSPLGVIQDKLAFDVRGFRKSYPTLRTSLWGRHQVYNAALSIAAAEALMDMGAVIPEKSIVAGIERTVWPGRFEIVRQEPVVVLDCAHNPASALVLAQAIKEWLPGKRVLLILGVSEDKDFFGIWTAFSEGVAALYWTQADHPRAKKMSDAEARAAFGSKLAGMFPSVREACQEALDQAAPQDVVVVAGSVFVVGEAREFLSAGG